MADEIKKPTKAETVAAFDASQLLKAINEARAKVGLPAHVSKLPLWKRWVNGEGPEFDTSGLRDVVNTYGYAIDDIKNHLDAFDERENNHYQEFLRFKAAQEAQPGSPFPFEG